MIDSSFDNITRRLDITPATRDTTYDKLRGRGRRIQKIPYTFHVPAIAFIPTDIGLVAGSVGFYVAQANFTAPSAFRILNPIVNVNVGFTNPVLVYIRSRVGGTVSRYMFKTLAGQSDETILSVSKVFCPVYTNQRIGANFTIEYYVLSINSPGTEAIKQSVHLNTNLLALPSSPDETEIEFEPTEVVFRNEVSSTYPEALPTVYPASSQWLTN